MDWIMPQLYEKYNYVFEELADPRVKHLFLMGSPFPITFIVGFYLYFVLSLGPRLMKNRPPFNLERIMVAYNLIQIVSCFHLVIMGIRHTLFRYSLICEPIDYSNNEFPLLAISLVWKFFLLKVFDLFDTVFFVLRKKTRQVSFLHVYHHTIMSVVLWITTKYIAGGHSLFVGWLNSFVHMFMYTYYLLSSWDKEYRKNLWWKKHLTHLQLAQFFILAIYWGQLLFQPNCSFPKWTAWVFFPQVLVVTILFTNFYIKTYIKPQKKPKLT